jgi:2-keto-4-pentenoate hydratase/2-oxohepta-3-ene-1,7-dioic acid hydratase in catechol pathway
MTIYCVGRNYVDHAKELGNSVPSTPLIFMKSPNSMRGLMSEEVAFATDTFHYEAEIVLHIGKSHQLGENCQVDTISELSLGVDLTRREVQSKLKQQGHPWTLAKSFVGSALVGKRYPLKTFDDLNSLEFQFSLNGVLKQTGNTSQMIFSFEKIINYLNSFSPVKQGDIVFTGTPQGVGEIHCGDHFTLSFPQLGISEAGVL